MWKRGVMLITMFWVVITAGTAGAASYEFESGISYLEHDKYYRWGIDWSLPNGEEIVGASLFFEDISNHDCDTNDLYAQLLPIADPGVSEGTDNGNNGNYFAGEGILLNHWQNLPDTPQNITYDFIYSELVTLMSYAADGNFGIGFDPDCLYEPKIALTVETKVVPIPASFFLLTCGLIGIFSIGRKTIRV